MMEIIEKTENMLKSYEYEQIFLKLNMINNEKILFDTLLNMDKKEEFEKAIIGLTYRTELSDELKIFLIKYSNYAFRKAKENCVEYLNNEYLKFLYHKEWEKIIKNSFYDSTIHGISIRNIDNELTNKFNEIIEKMDIEELSYEAQEFIKNYLLSIAFYDAITKDFDGKKDIMYDVVHFFEKYPINDIKNAKNKQLLLLFVLSQQMIKVNVNSLIVFERYHHAKVVNALGATTKRTDGIYEIRIFNLDDIYISTDDEFIRALFTVLHELGHLMQNVYKDNYPNRIKEIFNIEEFIIKNDYDFYLRNYDRFYIEIDANQYAFKLLSELLGNKYHEIILKIQEEEKIEDKLKEYNKFNIILIEKFNELNNVKNDDNKKL